MTYRIQQLTDALAPALSRHDGIAIAVDRDKEVFAIGGWQLNGIRHNVVSRSSDGFTFIPSTQPASFPPVHAAPAVIVRGRLTLFGGDQNGGGYHANIHSWSKNESEAWVDHGPFPFLNRVGHFAFVVEIDGEEFALIGGGQTVTPFSPAPTKFFNDLWAWDGITATLLYEDAPYQYRGYISSIAQMNGETALIGGGNYQTTDCARGYRTDSVKMTANMSWRLPTPRNGANLPAALYANTAAWDGKWWHIGGHDGAADRRAWCNSDDLKVWASLPPPPWAGRHAAVLFSFKDSLFYGTGAYASDMWRIYKVDPAKWHVNADWPGTGVTGMAALYTVVDEALTLTPGAIVDSLSLDLTNPRSLRPKIFRKTGVNSFEPVHVGAWAAHPGGGMADFSAGNFVVPDDGHLYKIGFSFGLNGQQDRYCYGLPSGRWMLPGDILAPATFSYYSDGNFSMGWLAA